MNWNFSNCYIVTSSMTYRLYIMIHHVFDWLLKNMQIHVYSWKSLKLQCQFLGGWFLCNHCVFNTGLPSSQDLHFRFMMIICSTYFRKEEDPHLYKFESPFQRTISAKFSSIWHNGFRCWMLKFVQVQQTEAKWWQYLVWRDLMMVIPEMCCAH